MTGDATWYKRKPDKMIRGCRGLGAAVIGCYNVVLDLIYADEDSAPNDPAFIGGILGESPRKTRALIDRLLEIGKLTLDEDGRLHNEKAEEVLNERASLMRIAKESGAKGGRSRAAKAAGDNKNKDMPQGPLNQGDNKTGDKNKNSEVPSLFSPEVAPPPSVVELPLIDGSGFGVTQKTIDGYKLAFPAVDVEQNLQAMLQWLIANPKNRKTRAGAPRFIMAWLAKRQDRSGHIPAGSPALSPQRGGAVASIGGYRDGTVIKLFPEKAPDA